MHYHPEEKRYKQKMLLPCKKYPNALLSLFAGLLLIGVTDSRCSQPSSLGRALVLVEQGSEEVGQNLFPSAARRRFDSTFRLTKKKRYTVKKFNHSTYTHKNLYAYCNTLLQVDMRATETVTKRDTGNRRLP